MRLSTEQLSRMSRLLDEVVEADAAAREQWLQSLASEHRDLEPALRRALLPGNGQAAPGELLVALPKIGVDPRLAGTLQIALRSARIMLRLALDPGEQAPSLRILATA